nr:hypothetical protein [Bacteroidota bacterium]
MKKYLSDKKFSKANEPLAQYQVNNIEFFTNFKDENEATAKLAASQLPIENLRNTHLMLVAIYKNEIENIKNPYFEITFTIIDGHPV